MLATRAFLLATAGLALASAIPVEHANARITRIVIDRTISPAFEGKSFGAAGQYEILKGRAYGELDPKDPHDALITDIGLAPKNDGGYVEYMTTFQIVKPVDMTKASRLMWHDVPNRGKRLTIVPAERVLGDVGLSSGWQGDDSGHTVPDDDNDYVVVPIAHNSDGSPVSGEVMARIMNASGPQSQPLYVHTAPTPYPAATLDTTKASLVTHEHEDMDGHVVGEKHVASADWAWAKCTRARPFPGIPDAREICVKGGFDPKLLYQVVYEANDPPILGIGFAAFRDLASFLKYAKADDAGTPNPLAGEVHWSITRGVSQSGNFIREFLHLGFNQDESDRQVYDGAWPIIAGRRLAMNYRFATPDGVLKLYEPGSEGTQTWLPSADAVRGLPTVGILDRCTATHTCPKIIEHFGAAEFWGLKLSPSFVGTAADKDVKLPANVRRYYIPSTQHGGGKGGFETKPLPPPSCPGVGYGKGELSDNPVPHTETRNAIRAHFRDWVMKGTPPPPSVYPTIAAGTLVDPTAKAMGFPHIPGLPKGAPTGLVNPLIDYDFGPGFDREDISGVITKVPPGIKRVIAMKVPKVDADGNELGGVPVVLRDAPLGTYLGWNVTAAGFHAGQLCNYAGGMIPFAKTKAERMAKGDPRPSLEERYGTHEGYVAAVKKAAAHAQETGFLLPADAEKLIAEAAKSDVLR
jgi:Alpha/beta hydrolase domain